MGGGGHHVGFDSAGNAIVSYIVDTIVGGGSDVRIKAVRYDAGTSSWGASQFIAADTTYSVQESQLAVSGDGDAFAVWIQSDATNTTSMVASRYDAGSATWAAQIIDTTTPAGNVGSLDPQVAVDANGNAWAIWDRITDSQGTHIWVNRYTVGGGWGTAQFIDPVPGAGARYPQVAFDASGHAMAVWAESLPLVQNGPLYPLTMASYNTGGSWGAGQVLETVAGQSGDPEIVLDAAGNATAVWDKMDASGVNITIWSARFQ